MGYNKVPESQRRITINRMIAPETLRLIKKLAKQYEESEGRVLDRAVRELAVEHWGERNRSR